MSDQFAENKSFLVRGMINVVGEYHSESTPRRDLEKLFISERIGSDNYWTETQFVDQYKGRQTRDASKRKAQNEGADLMEFRAAEVAAMLVDRFEGLCDEASRVGAITDDTGGAAVTAFVTVNLDKFATLKNTLASRWKATTTKEVNDAVEAIHQKVDYVLALYKKVMGHAVVQASTEQQLTATRALANKRAEVTALLPALCSSVGEPEGTTAKALDARMIERRSAFMGLGASFSGQSGVWKIGDGHVDQLTQSVNVNRSNAHFVSREDFNEEFDLWKIQKGIK